MKSLTSGEMSSNVFFRLANRKRENLHIILDSRERLRGLPNDDVANIRWFQRCFQTRHGVKHRLNHLTKGLALALSAQRLRHRETVVVSQHASVRIVYSKEIALHLLHKVLELNVVFCTSL